MYRLILPLLSFILLPSAIHAQGYHLEWPGEEATSVSNADKYTLVGVDNFDGKTLNDQYWKKIKRYPNGPQWNKYMSNNSSLYSFKKGYLRLYARVNKGIERNDTAHYLTGGISTENKLTVKYGKIEIRARISQAQGVWPAIWLGPNNIEDKKYPKYGEIDIVEHYNYDNTIVHTVHNNYTDQLKIKTPKNDARVEVDVTKWNVYAVEILPNAVIFSINNQETFRYPKIQTNEEGQYPFGLDMFLMIDMQVGGKYLKVNNKTFPAYMDIDWVKFWKYNN